MRALSLRTLDVGPTVQQLRGDRHHHRRWRPRDARRAAEQVGQVGRREAQQRTERVLSLADFGLELRDLRLGVLEQGRRLLNVERGGAARFEAGLRDLEALALDLGVAARERQLLLAHADLHVAGGYLADQAHQDVVVVGDRGQ
jgi:hypothetical protein